MFNVILIGDRISIEPIRIKHWTVSYIELLHRLQLWGVAAEIIGNSTDPNVKILNQRNTTMHTSCPDCNKPIVDIGWMCEHCKKPTNTCSLWYYSFF